MSKSWLLFGEMLQAEVDGAAQLLKNLNNHLCFKRMAGKGEGNFTSKRLLHADALKTYAKLSFYRKTCEDRNVHRLF